MATKANVSGADYTGGDLNRVETMEFRIEGLEVVDARDGVIRLKDVPVVNVDWQAIRVALEHAGISAREAEDYVDDFADLIGQDMIAKLFARRAKRIG